MSPALGRLKRRAEFLRVAGTRLKWVAPGLILQARRQAIDDSQAEGSLPVRVGFTVSRKVGNAVVRNRARRRLRAAVEQVFPEHAAPGVDFVVIGRQGTLKRPFPGLIADLEAALQRLDTYRANDGQGGKAARRPV